MDGKSLLRKVDSDAQIFMPQGFGTRFYQKWGQTQDLCPFRVTVQETELLILAGQDLSGKAKEAVMLYRGQLQDYINRHPEFQTSLVPIDVEADAPAIIQDMSVAAKKSGVGPFAAVAGTMAEYAGRDLLRHSPEIIVENGGDIFVSSSRDRILGIYAGDSPLSGKIALKIEASHTPCGVCTSSGTVGHSLSFGKADAAIVIARSTALADACATAIGNLISSSADIQKGLLFAERIEGVDGTVIIAGNEVGAWGNVQFVKPN